MWLVFLLYALFASVFTISKEALTASSPLFLVGARMVVAGIILFAFEWIRGKATFSISKRAFQKILLLAAFNIYLCNALEFWGLKYLTSFKTCFIYSLCPFVSALFSYLMFKETLSLKKWLGLAVGFGAFIPVLLADTAFEEAAGQLWHFSWPEFAIVGAAVSSVLGWIFLKQLVKEENISPMTANSYSMAIGGVAALLHSLAVEPWFTSSALLPVSNYTIFASCTALLILISNFICYNLYGYLLKRFSATFLSFAGLSTPLFSALFGWLAYGEATTLSFWISYIGVLLGLVVFYSEELQLGETKVTA